MAERSTGTGKDPNMPDKRYGLCKSMEQTSCSNSAHDRCVRSHELFYSAHTRRQKRHRNNAAKQFEFSLWCEIRQSPPKTGDELNAGDEFLLVLSKAI